MKLNTFKWIVIVVEMKRKMATISLMIATFLNPFGFDILVYKITQLTNEYWHTMYVLYGLAFLSLSLSYLFFKLNKRTIGNLLITLGLFLNPLGYDWVVYGVNQLTQDYWTTMSIMYFLAITFFGVFVYLSNIKIYEIIKYNTIKTKNKLTTKTYKNE
jgi:hypothetical protein